MKLSASLNARAAAALPTLAITIRRGYRGAATGVMLSKIDDAAAYESPMAGVILGCDDAAATAEKLRAAGVEVTDPETQHWGTFILVTEPDGRKICVTQTDTQADTQAGSS